MVTRCARRFFPWQWLLVIMLTGGVATTWGLEAISLGVSEATTLKYETPVDTVFIANPELADYQVVQGNQLIVYGKRQGRTTLVVLDGNGETLANTTLLINKNLSFIRQQLAARFPDSQISLMNLGDQVIVSGRVPSEQLRQEIYSMTGELLGKERLEEKATLSGQVGDNIAFMTRLRYKGLVDNLEVTRIRQVNVKLTIAEVSYKLMRQLGIKWSGRGLGVGQFTDMLNNKLNAANIARSISAVDDDGMAKILAEPNLSVVSGETASFLAGGEMPVVSRIDNASNVSYKEFGVRLKLAANVLRDDKIRLFVQPEVSAVDLQYGTNDMPAFKTRRTSTTIQLGDGDSFVLGGLLNSEDIEGLAKIPYIGDLPFFGALFRHVSKERRKSELVIVVTVNLVKPVSADVIQLPQLSMTSSLSHFFNIIPQPEGSLGSQAAQILATGGFKQ